MQSESNDLDTLVEYVEALRSVRIELTQQLAKANQSDGKLASDVLDTAQVALYELSFAAAEIDAAAALISYATRAGTALSASLAGFLAAEVGGTLQQRAHLVTEALGLPAVHVARCPAPAVGGIAKSLRLAQGDLGPDLIDEDKRLMRTTFRQFAAAVVQPRAEAIHREDRSIPNEIIEGLRQLGCFGLSVPECFGGVRPDDRDDSLGMLVATEELSRASLGAAGSLITRPDILARALLEGGTDAQKAKWLPAVARGEPLCAVSITEPNTGSDVAAAMLRATPTAGGWLLSGGKTWCTLAGLAGVIMVIARTDADARPLHRGLTLFLVEKPSTSAHSFVHEDGRGGRVSGRAIPTIGYRGMHSYEMFYDSLFVPDANVIGEAGGLGKGFYFTMRGFSGGRIQTAARATGLMQAAFDAALRYSESRQVFGKPVADFPLTQYKLVRMAAWLQACRQLSYEVGEQMDRGAGQMEASLVKLVACKAAEWVTREAMQIHGGMGYAEETAVSRFFVDARVLSIFEGAEETLAIRVIGKELLDRAHSGASR